MSLHQNPGWGFWSLLCATAIAPFALPQPTQAEVSATPLSFDAPCPASLCPGVSAPETAIAQIPTPNQDRFLQPDANPPQPLAPESPASAPAAPALPTEPVPSSPSQQIFVKTIAITGSTILTAADLASEIQPLVDRTVAVEELEQLAALITERYLRRGYITSRAILNRNSLEGGNIEIQVLEGKIETIEVEGAGRLANYVRDRVSVGAGTPVNTSNLEAQLRLLRADPLLDNIEASVRPGETPGGSFLAVRVTPAQSFISSVSIDNYSPPSIGSERFSINALYRNALGLGDVFDASFKTTLQGGSRTLDLGYRVPLNPYNGTLQLRTSLNSNNVIQGLGKVFDISGQSQLYEISYRQPLIRTPREEFALSAGFTYQTGQTFTFAGPFPFGFGPDPEGRSTTSVFKFGQDYVLRDVAGAWAARSQFSFGTQLFNATENPEPTPDGQFISWLLQVQRVQVLNENNFLLVSADLQLANDGLLPSQQFVIGGGQSLRGYRQNARAGDNGFRLSVEDRITLERDEAGGARFIFIPFIDLGWVWNAGDNPNTLPDGHFLAGIGAGAIWQPLERLSIRLDYGYPLVKLPDRGTNAQDDGFYFSVNYQF